MLPENQEGRIELAINTYRSDKFRSKRKAAAAFNVHHQKLSNRLNEIRSRATMAPNCRNLTPTKEGTLEQYILDLDLREFAPLLSEVADMADKLLAVRGKGPVGRNWPERFVARSEKLKATFSRAKDRQRVLQEDPEVINAWFRLIMDTKAKYGVHDDDIHNFDETGFQIGIIGTMKVVTG